jgi:putative addiction module killer protein
MYSMSYTPDIIEIRQTEVFARWIERLRDRQAVARIQVRIRRLSLGLPGDVRAVRAGVCELRVDYGPGYRVYFTRRLGEWIVLLVGGDKRTQQEDIRLAVELASGL